MGTPPPIEFASLGMADSLILMVLALVVFGPRRLPQIGRQIGKLMYEFRKASNDFKFQMEEELRSAEDADRRKKEEDERQRNLALTPPAQTIEAQAGIGAVESPAASPDPVPSPYPGEGQYPAAYPPETPAVEPQQVITVPRIQPPLTGEQVSAATPTSSVSAADTTSEANIGADPASVQAPYDSATEPAKSDNPDDLDKPAAPSHSEAVSQHG
jgi:sec-independent protein translocase protein TatB